MSGTTTLVLGGGFGGLSAARHLRQLLTDQRERIVLVDRSPTFTVGATKTWVMLGEVEPRAVRHSRASLGHLGIDVRQSEVTAIDLAGREVTVGGERLHWDYLVIALGAALDMSAVPGLADAAHTFYTLDGAEKLQRTLASWQGGKLVLLIPRAPFQCPPGPYEAAMLLADHMKRRRLSQSTSVSIYTVEVAPMPTAGPEAGEQMKRQLAEQKIEAFFQKRTKAVDAQRKVILFDDGSEARFDLLVAIPPHVAPRVVRDAGLLNEAGWVPADPRTLEVKGHRDVFAVGDVAVIPLPGRFKPEMPLVLPKAGIFAEAHGRAAASCIAGRVLGRDLEQPFDGKGFCYVEIGDRLALRGDGSFFELPNPKMSFTAPEASLYEEKKKWVEDWLRSYL